jgi:hypothetical protein|uniref:KilA-N domain-containing protein n=1 Tax=viral metagenome TaxID=1070528 RepID=A0A6C0CZP6_9ZZZZ
MNCEYCNESFKNISSFNHHQKTAKYCLIKRGLLEEENNIIVIENHICKYCDKRLTTKASLERHLECCNLKFEKTYKEIDKLKKYNLSLLKQISDYEKKVQEQKNKYDQQVQEHKNQIQEQRTQIKELQDSITSIAAQPKIINNNHHEFMIDSDEKIQNKQNTLSIEEENIEEENQLSPLFVCEGITIESREDGYIDVTHLCKIGGQDFKEWKSLERTQMFLKAFSQTVGIPIIELIQNTSDENNEDHIWVHPQVANNISQWTSQWISPETDVKLSSWIYEVMLTGKVDIKNTKSYQELRAANKDKELKIQYLTKKYVKRQPRIQYDVENVIYILTTPTHKQERRYILGKAENLTNRLSVYNKTDEHEVVYYGGCRDEISLKLAEQMIFYNLEKYREQANRERFVLPENSSINLFIDEIKRTITFFSKD